MHLKKFLLCTLLLLLSVGVTKAQQTWFEGDINKSIGEKFEISVKPEVRFKEGFELDEYFIEPGLEYDFNDYFSLGAGYRIGNNLKKNGDAQWFGRYSLDAKTGYDWNNFEVQLRARYTNFDDFIGDNSDKINFLRFRLKLEYDIKKLDLKPYAAYEVYRNLEEGAFTKARWELGVEYALNKHHDIGAYFRLHDYLNVEDESVKIIGITYSWKI